MKESSQLKTFVVNRVATIQDLTSPQQWRHIPTNQNPADLVSRGLDPDKLSHNSLWSIRNCRTSQKKSGSLDSEEFQRSETYLIKFIQGVDFQKEIKHIQGTGMVRDINIKPLHPFLDENGVLRVGGRLLNNDLDFNSKFPILLPSNHKVTKLTIEYFHKKYLHAGPQALLHEIRQKFWPLSDRSLCRKMVHECFACFRAKPIVTSQLMGNLPRDRVVQDYPFNCSGVDLCGPFVIKYPNQRKGTLQKIYVCIFVCFSTKCVHIEIVTDFTSAALIATLKRFFARRGKSTKIYSDNARNFVGADTEIKRIMNVVLRQDTQFSGYLSSEGIEWKFIPPRVQSFGGLREAAVKPFKYHFKRVVGALNLTYDEFLTVSAQIEGVLNSKPLCPLSNDADDFNVLTSAHFTIGRSMSTIIELSLIDLNENCLKKWQRVTLVVQLLWKKWSRSHLSGLQQRNKWYFQKDNVKIGDLVVLIEDNVPTYKWPLGRIIELYKDDDNLVRVVRVKTQSGIYKRAIYRVCILPKPN
ncbi:uncharacterized protein [Parasteatoda tepidariorum]|uniref:uncharacterized protein n=1 Tax=Parasteatoda tepidariorum TaxID=114398 RepID=UPI0039BD277F